MICAACGSASEGTPICPGCGLELPEAPRSPSREVLRAAGAPEEAVPLAPEAPAPLAPDAARCSVHPLAASVGTCARCGRFACLTCVPDALTRRSWQCPECAATVAIKSVPARIAQYRRELVGSFAAVGLVLIAMALVIIFVGLPSAQLAMRVGVGILLIPSGLALCAAAAAYGLSHRAWLGWVGMALEAMVLLPLALTLRNLFSLALIAAPVVSVVRLWQLADLERTPPPSHPDDGPR